MPIEFFNTFEVSAPTCPHCAHEMRNDEMRACGKNLFALAVDASRTEVTCPSPTCGKTYWLKGGYRPHYTSGVTEEDL
jgi:uncharacterized protein with PIN domain